MASANAGLKLKSEALSAQEWNYLRGLFLADGYSDLRLNGKGWVHLYRVRFFLQGNEEEIAHKVIALLSRAGLNPCIDKDSHKNLIIVRDYSKALLYFLPDKEALRSDPAAREKFFDENKLFDVAYGVPFIAGFIDGDGSCGVTVIKRRFESVSMLWRFSQSSLRFMIDYVVRFVDSLSPNSVSVGEILRKDGYRDTAGWFRKPAMDALLRVGIAEHSWKVVQCLKEVAAFRSEFRNYYTVGKAAHALGVKPWVVRRMVDAGEISCNRAKITGHVPNTSHRYIPIQEVERLKKELETKRCGNEQAKQGGVKLRVLAKLLDISSSTLEWLRLNGKLRATLVQEDHGRGSSYLVIPWEEVKRLKKIYELRKKGEKRLRVKHLDEV